MKRTGVFKNNSELILASGSPRRKAFLEELGLDFTVVAANIDESPLENEAPGDFVMRAARDKGLVIADQYPDSWVLAADTIVVLGGAILGKPDNIAEAERILLRLAGKGHEVLTGFFLLNSGKGIEVGRVVTTEVVFTSFSEKVARAYVATREPLDKAGAYGIQGQGGCFVKRINGSYSNVVGLPLAELVSELLRHGVVSPVDQ